MMLILFIILYLFLQMYENRSDLYSLTDTKITKPTHNFSFNGSTLFMFSEAEPYVFRVRNLRFRFGKRMVFTRKT